MKNFCCSISADLFDDAGRKGFALLPEKMDEGDYIIILQSRNLDIEAVEGKLTVIQRAIGYCPFCGSKFDEVIEQHIDEIESYANKNRKLLMR